MNVNLLTLLPRAGTCYSGAQREKQIVGPVRQIQQHHESEFAMNYYGIEFIASVECFAELTKSGAGSRRTQGVSKAALLL